LQVTNASVASANFGAAQITAVSAASANLGVAAITTGTVTDLTATSASVASMNAGVALLTTATVTNFTASGASIASANIGNLQFTAASIASINAGVAVINNLTATSASIASANVGVALITTGTVTALTATGASVASANVGTAVITGLTVTGASIASVNAGTATLSGNLTLSGGTANGVLYLNGSKVATSGSALTYDGTSFVGPNFRANSFIEIRSDTASLYWENAANTRYYSTALTGSSTSPTLATTYFDGTSVLSRLALDSSGNLGIGTSSPTNYGATYKTLAVNGSSTGIVDVMQNGTVYGQLSTEANVYKVEAVGASTVLRLVTNSATRATIDSSGNLGLGVTPSAWASGYKALQVGATGALWQSTSGFTFLSDNAYVDSGAANRYITSNYATLYRQQSGQHNWFTAPSWNGTGSDAISFTQAMTLDASSNLFVGGTTGSAKLNLQTTTNSSSDSEYIRLYNAGENVGYISWINGNGDLARITGTKTGGGASANDGILTFSTATDTVLTERARITSGGYSKFSTNGTYGGGPTTSAYEFNWSDASRFQIRNNTATAANAYGIEIRYQALPNGTGNEFLYCADNDAANLRASIRSNGGIANYQANDANLSDERTKTDIRPVGSYWDKIKAIEIVAFKYKDQTHDDDNIGAIAQQVESVAPEFVDVDGWGETPEDGVPLKSIYTTDMYHAAIKALQEAMTRIEQLEAKVAALESK
jgi:hypothetical protein